MHLVTPVLLVVALTVAAACGGSTSNDDATRPQGGPEPVALDPADFTSAIDNPWWPMSPGSRWVYGEADAQGASCASR